MGISFLMIQCSKSVDPLEPTSKILFNREGGGSKEFYVTTNSSHDIIANVIRYDFRDTNYTTTVFAEDSGRLSNLISNIMDNKVTITGDFHQSTKPTGTWAYLYVVSVNNTLTEITNTSVRDSLMKLEMMVENAG
jgi:hypothetical protein